MRPQGQPTMKEPEDLLNISDVLWLQRGPWHTADLDRLRRAGGGRRLPGPGLHCSLTQATRVTNTWVSGAESGAQA